MKVSRFFTIGFGLAFLCVMSAPSAKADSWNQATEITFTGPVAIPGVALPTGTYWFTLADSNVNRNIVQVWSSDRRQLLATTLAIADVRLQTTGRPVVKFDREHPLNDPEELRAWFYPGDSLGHQFVYPQAMARAIARQSDEPVLSMRSDPPATAVPSSASTVAALEHAKLMVVSPNGSESNYTPSKE